MKLSDFFVDPATVEELLTDARFFAQRAQDLNFVAEMSALYVAHGMDAEVTENQVRHLKDVGCGRRKDVGCERLEVMVAYNPLINPRTNFVDPCPSPERVPALGASQPQLDDWTIADAGPPAEADPHGIDPHASGSKLDAGKQIAGVLLDFSRALEAVADVGTFGAHKYCRGGWQSVPEGEQRYMDALMRHLLKMQREELDPDSGLDHLAHVCWNALAVLELKRRAA